MKVTIIGAGNMGGAIARGLAKGTIINTAEITVSDPSEPTLQALQKEYPDIRKYLWKEAFWSQSFCLITTGGASVETIRKYIESQGEKS